MLELRIRTACVLVLCICLCFFGGCSKGASDTKGLDYTGFIYENANNAALIFCFNETLYSLSSAENGNGVISAFNMNGEVLFTEELPELECYNVKYMCAASNSVYLAVSIGETASIYEMDLNSKFVTKLIEIPNAKSLSKIGCADGRIFWLGTGGEIEYVPPFKAKSGEIIYYENMGMIFGWYDIEKNSLTQSDIKNPVTFAVSENAVFVYAYDEAGGYFFYNLDSPDDKIYTNKLGSITSFEFYGKDNEIAFIGSSAYEGTLPITRIDDTSGIIKVSNNIYSFFASDLCVCGNYAFVLTADNSLSYEKHIKRFQLSEQLLSGEPIKIISSQYFSEIPFAAGVETQFNRLSDDGFSLTVLSLDSNYDLAMINSAQLFSNDIRTKGAFYPLNDIAGVQEYLDSCFPYIKEAASDEDGNIWMLPISIDIPVIVYNAENCLKNNISFSSDMSDFLDMVNYSYSNSEYCDCNRYELINYAFYQCLSSGNSFNTDEFRKTALLLKEKCTPEIFTLNFDLYSSLITAQGDANDLYYGKIYKDFLFTFISDSALQLNIINDANLRAAALPKENNENIAVCTFLCVNPYSEHLEEAIDYIESVAQNYNQKNKSFVLSDKTMYGSGALSEDLYDIYKNAKIVFAIPDEVFNNDFAKYLSSEITIDEFISEADRKLSAYLNE